MTDRQRQFGRLGCKQKKQARARVVTKNKRTSKKFSARTKLDRVRYLEPKKLRILTPNVWGLRTKGTEEDLQQFLRDFQVDVGIITETHLLDHVAKSLVIPGYKMAGWNGKHTNKGGVLIMAAMGVACSTLKDLARPHKDIDAC